MKTKNKCPVCKGKGYNLNKPGFNLKGKKIKTRCLICQGKGYLKLQPHYGYMD